MRLHNYFEFITGKKKKTVFNTLLPGLNEKFLAGQTFTESIAFGKGAHASAVGIGAPANALGQKQCRLYDCNFDASKGPLFVKKYIELLPDEFGGEVITEAGFLSSGGELVNYVKIPGGITKPQGEGLVIIGTLLLEVSADCSGSFAHGENPLFKLLLGQIPHSGAEFRLEAGGARLSMQKRTEQEKLKISAALPQQCDHGRVTLSVDGQPCVIFDAADYESTQENEDIPLEFSAGGAVVEAEGLVSVNAVKTGGGGKPFSAVAVPSGAGEAVRNPFQVTLKDAEPISFSPRGKFAAVFGKDILMVYDVQKGLKPLESSYYSFAFSDVVRAFPDDEGNLFVQINKAPYVRVLQNIGGTLHPCGMGSSFPAGITEIGLSQWGENVYLKCSAGSGSYRAHYSFLTNISDRYYTHTQVAFSEGYIRRFYSQTDDGEVLLELDTGQTGGNRAVPERVRKLLSGCRQAKLHGNLFYIMTDGRWRLYGPDGGEIPLYDSGIRKIFVSGSGNVVKLYANNKLSGCWVCGSSGRVYHYPIDVKFDGEVTGAAVSDCGMAVICASKHTENLFVPLVSGRFALFSEGLSGAAVASVSRRSFKSFAGREVSLQLEISEV